MTRSRPRALPVTLALTEEEVRRLEQVLRGSPEWGPDNIKHKIWRKAADAVNRLDDVEYRRLYGVALPRSLSK